VLGHDYFFAGVTCSLVKAVGSFAQSSDFCEVELLETHVSEGVEGVVNAEILVGEAGSRCVGQSTQ